MALFAQRDRHVPAIEEADLGNAGALLRSVVARRSKGINGVGLVEIERLPVGDDGVDVGELQKLQKGIGGESVQFSELAKAEFQHGVRRRGTERVRQERTSVAK